MNDDQIHHRIENLVSEEQKLWEREAQAAANGTTAGGSIRRGPLDQCWDLLRQPVRCKSGLDRHVASGRSAGEATASLRPASRDRSHRRADGRPRRMTGSPAR